MRYAIPALVVMLLSPLSRAAEGMWLLEALPREALSSRYQFEPAPDFIERTRKASVRLAGGCSGSFVSPQGLVLTNAHCVMDCVQALTDGGRNLAETGWVAGPDQPALRCPAMELNQLQHTEDVTRRIRAATVGLRGEAFARARNAEQSRIEAECVGTDAATRRCDVVELYDGGQYHLYQYRRYDDVRLAFVPEAAIGFFGGDPDNFNFPRYTLDAALLRAYDGDAPAATPDHFRILPAGAQAGELTLVTGHPGSTKRLMTVSQLRRERDVDVLETLLYLAELRGVLLQFSRQGAAAAQAAATELMQVENAYKVYEGRLRALNEPSFFERKAQQAAALRKALSGNDPALEALAGAEARIAEVQAIYRDLYNPYQLIERGRGLDSAYFRHARNLVRAAVEREKPDARRMRGYTEAELPRLQQRLTATVPVDVALERARLAWSLGKLRDRLGPDDPFVQLVLGGASPAAVADRLVKGTKLGDPAVRAALWGGGAEAVSASDDPFIQLARAVDPLARQLRQRYEHEVEAVENREAETLAGLRFEAYGDSVYPDATFTLRLSYGEVRGWTERGEAVAPFTRFEGLFGRATGSPPFALPPRWLAARDHLPLQTPLNFVTTNDIIGGNSGSPVLNREGALVGLAFDGNRHSLGGAYGYDPRSNRCVAVHAGAIVTALSAVYQADALVAELNPQLGEDAAP